MRDSLSSEQKVTLSSWQWVEERILYLIDGKYQFWEEELEKLAQRKAPGVNARGFVLGRVRSH